MTAVRSADAAEHGRAESRLARAGAALLGLQPPTSIEPAGCDVCRRAGVRWQASSSSARARSAPASTSSSTARCASCVARTSLPRSGPGEFFGELSVIDQQPRSASVHGRGAYDRASRSHRGTCSRCSSRIPALALNLHQGYSPRACVAPTSSIATLASHDRRHREQETSAMKPGPGAGRRARRLEPVRRPRTAAARGGRPHDDARSRSRPASASCARASPAPASTSSSTARSAVASTARTIARLGKGDFFGEMSILLGRAARRRHRGTRRPLHVLHLAGPELRGLPARLSRRSCSACSSR